jgi:hypothetical protein
MSYETISRTEDTPTREARERTMQSLKSYSFAKPGKDWATLAYSRHVAKEIRYPPMVMEMIRHAMSLDGKDTEE